MLVTEKIFVKQLVNEIPWSCFRHAIIRMRRIDRLILAHDASNLHVFFLFGMNEFMNFAFPSWDNC